MRPERRIAARPRKVVPCVTMAAVLSGCEGVQSVLSPASDDARMVADLAWWMFATATFIFVVTMGLLITGVALRHGREARRISFRNATVMVVIGGVIAPIAAIVAVSLSGVMIGDEVEGDAGSSGPVIEVHGKRWWWEFRYLDADGRVIATTANELHLPVGQRSTLRLMSDNVIHSFWAPNLQGKTDLVPGKVNTLYAEPEVAGRWRGQCAEFCGLQHGLMGFVVQADAPQDFDRWLQAQAAGAAVTEGRGLQVFMDLGCGECHAIRGTAADGRKGPDLTHLASRRTLAAATIPNSRGNLGGWITSPQDIKPGALMPAFAPPPDDLDALLTYLEALE
ncbi:MAG: cytochrome c oxidase subunit II [Paracoccus sp. (in: a-proteobacteria)]|uniref:cytochrome c oxidase subunit II n=1 Tax=Paracoccus sp. TaxID=267 RepID=UPI004059FA0F